MAKPIEPSVEEQQAQLRLEEIEGLLKENTSILFDFEDQRDNHRARYNRYLSIVAEKTVRLESSNPVEELSIEKAKQLLIKAQKSLADVNLTIQQLQAKQQELRQEQQTELSRLIVLKRLREEAQRKADSEAIPSAPEQELRGISEQLTQLGQDSERRQELIEQRKQLEYERDAYISDNAARIVTIRKLIVENEQSILQLDKRIQSRGFLGRLVDGLMRLISGKSALERELDSERSRYASHQKKLQDHQENVEHFNTELSYLTSALDSSPSNEEIMRQIKQLKFKQVRCNRWPQQRDALLTRIQGHKGHSAINMALLAFLATPNAKNLAVLTRVLQDETQLAWLLDKDLKQCVLDVSALYPALQLPRSVIPLAADSDTVLNQILADVYADKAQQAAVVKDKLKSVQKRLEQLTVQREQLTLRKQSMEQAEPAVLADAKAIQQNLHALLKAHQYLLWAERTQTVIEMEPDREEKRAIHQVVQELKQKLAAIKRSLPDRVVNQFEEKLQLKMKENKFLSQLYDEDLLAEPELRAAVRDIIVQFNENQALASEQITQAFLLDFTDSLPPQKKSAFLGAINRLRSSRVELIKSYVTDVFQHQEELISTNYEAIDNHINALIGQSNDEDCHAAYERLWDQLNQALDKKDDQAIQAAFLAFKREIQSFPNPEAWSKVSATIDAYCDPFKQQLTWQPDRQLTGANIKAWLELNQSLEQLDEEASALHEQQAELESTLGSLKQINQEFSVTPAAQLHAVTQHLITQCHALKTSAIQQALILYLERPDEKQLSDLQQTIQSKKADEETMVLLQKVGALFEPIQSLLASTTEVKKPSSWMDRFKKQTGNDENKENQPPNSFRPGH